MQNRDDPVFDIKCPKCGATPRNRCTEPGKLSKFRVVVKTHKERYDKLNESKTTTGL